MIIPILQGRSSSLERISDLSKVTQRAGDRDGFRAQEGALKNISLSLFFIAFKNKPWLLNIIIPVIDFKLEPLPEMLNDKYSYYQREHSEKLIASICLMSVCVHTCGEGSDFGSNPRGGGSYGTVNCQLGLLAVSQGTIPSCCAKVPRGD